MPRSLKRASRSGVAVGGRSVMVIPPLDPRAVSVAAERGARDARRERPAGRGAAARQGSARTPPPSDRSPPPPRGRRARPRQTRRGAPASSDGGGVGCRRSICESHSADCSSASASPGARGRCTDVAAWSSFANSSARSTILGRRILRDPTADELREGLEGLPCALGIVLGGIERVFHGQSPQSQGPMSIASRGRTARLSPIWTRSLRRWCSRSPPRKIP